MCRVARPPRAQTNACRVGCAVLTASGTIVQGANVENASYGASVCAERATICTAVLRGDRQFRAIGISSDMEDIITPCGICRQFIREFGADIPVFMFKRDGHYVKMTLNELLPLSFGPDKLL